MRLCSACLLGIKCRYDGKDNLNKKIVAISKKETLIPVCPEQLGGQSTPRPNAEISGGDGSGVLDGKAKVIEPGGNDVTKYFVKGAEEVLKMAKLHDIKEVILTQRSPSCGSGQIYDGTFSKKLIKGDGVTTALLKRNKIKVISDSDL
ncbi:MAG: DUF523 domain-containing protein [Candidatus Aenigmarchaeota archaeon]|nr:DUF523 domain-containing protein [Candidatus Aenigmarchaeota archaeon]